MNQATDNTAESGQAKPDQADAKLKDLCGQLLLASVHPLAPTPVRLSVAMLADVLKDQQARIAALEDARAKSLARAEGAEAFARASLESLIAAGGDGPAVAMARGFLDAIDGRPFAGLIGDSRVRLGSSDPVAGCAG